MVKDIPGWSPVDQLYTLFNLAYLTTDLEGDIVEIGSWCGRSTSVLGLAARMIGNTKVFCIDLFPEKNDWKQNPDGSYYFEVAIGNQIFRAHQEHSVWEEPFEQQTSRIYEEYNSPLDCFVQTVRNNNLQNIIKVHRGTSSTFVSSIGADFRCKLLFIDADHGYQAVCQDIKNMEPYLVEGGWICFDDAFSCYEGVNRAVSELIINNPAYELCQQMTRKFFIARKNMVRFKT